MYIKSTDQGRLLPLEAQSVLSVLAYNLNNVCNTGAPRSQVIGTWLHIVVENNAQAINQRPYYTTIYCACQYTNRNIL